jgi:hypothetical protein
MAIRNTSPKWRVWILCLTAASPNAQQQDWQKPFELSHGITGLRKGMTRGKPD